MWKIAIDIVLLPSDEMMNKAIELNKKIALPEKPDFELNKTDCIPHITLSMSCIEESNLDKIKNILSDISKSYSSFNLTIEEFRLENLGNDKKYISLNLGDNSEVKKLHKDIMINLQPYLTYEPSKDMFVNPKEINDITIEWLSWWSAKGNKTNSFMAHLSLWVGNSVECDFPINFTSNRIAVFQLWNYCTCREKLFVSKI